MKSKRALIGFATLAVAAALTVGVATALAGGGLGGKKASATLLANAAKNLGVTTAKLNAAILADANARIDKAVKAGDLDEDQAADLKDDIAASPALAIPLTTATGVARELGTTKAKLDAAFRAARKTAMIAKIDAAVADDRLTADEAKELKADLEENADELPGYKGGFGFGGGPGRGHHGPGGFGGHGFGGAPDFGGFGGPAFGSSSGSSTSSGETA